MQQLQQSMGMGGMGGYNPYAGMLGNAGPYGANPYGAPFGGMGGFPPQQQAGGLNFNSLFASHAAGSGKLLLHSLTLRILHMVVVKAN